MVTETYRQINLGDRELGRRRYSFSEIRKVRLKDDGSLTSSLILKARKKEQGATGQVGKAPARKVPDKAYDEYTSSLSLTSESYPDFEKRARIDAGLAIEEEETPAAAEEKGPRLRRLKSKIADAVFDFSEIEQEKIEQEIDKLVNFDGYYDEVEPVDADVDYKEERHINKPALIAAGILLIYIILILVF